MKLKPDAAFQEWCQRKWTGYAKPEVLRCNVWISQACIEQARAAYPANANVEYGVCLKIGASYFDELNRKYHIGQIRHELKPPMQGSWYILIYNGQIYVETNEHPVPTRERRARLDAE